MTSSTASTTTCQICGESLKKLTDSHVKKHGLNLQEYTILHGSSNGRHQRCAHRHAYTGHECQLHVVADSDETLCILHSRDEVKDLKLFNKIFKKLFEVYVEARNNFHFEGIVFPDGPYFAGEKFEGNVFFNDCIFRGKASFWMARFKGEASFRSCHFQEVSFRFTTFTSGTTFHGSQFHGAARFDGTKFYTAPAHVRFTNIRFEKPEQIVFRENDFSQAFFSDTDLSKVNIENISWPKTSLMRGGRRYLTEEFYYTKEVRYYFGYHCFANLRGANVPAQTLEKLKTLHYESFSRRGHILKELKKYLSPSEYSQHAALILKSAYFNQLNSVRLSYQRLKHNYEERKSFVEAGDFYYGEMECYRRSSHFRRFFPFSMTNLYRISSGYGQRYIRASIVLIVLMTLFAGIQMFWGIQPTEHNNDYPVIDYNIEMLPTSQAAWVSDFFITTIYCVEVLTRQEEPDRLFRPLTTKGEVINIIFSMLIYLQLVFFALALRRHFKR